MNDNLAAGVFGFLLNMGLPDFLQRVHAVDDRSENAGLDPAADLFQVMYGRNG